MRLGHVERAILGLLDNHPQLPLPLIALVNSNQREDVPAGAGVSKSVYESCRRAAHTLEEKGLVVLRYGLSPFGPCTMYVIHARKGQPMPHLTSHHFDGLWSNLKVQQAVLDFLERWGPVPYRVLRWRVFQQFTGFLGYSCRGGTAITRAVQRLHQQGKLRFWKTGRTRADWTIGLPDAEPYIPPEDWPCEVI